MPLGESHFAFVMYEDDSPSAQSSEIAYCDYELLLDVTLTGEQARNLLQQALVASGYLSDVDGHVEGVSGFRQFQPNTIISENDVYYYLLDELFVSPDGVTQKNGNRFAVDITTGESFSAKETEDGYFQLTKIQ
jgi:hypothetical protein